MAALSPTTVESRQETLTTRTFFFELAEKELDYQPGQYLTIKLEGVTDPNGPQRPFTLSTSPTERQQIGITIKMTGSPFKKALLQIAEQQPNPGDRIRMRGPIGSFVLEEDRPAIMIAGGIGITPFRSMIRYVKDQEIEIPIILLYSNDKPEDIAFRNELDAWDEEEDWLTVIHTITRPSKTKIDWSGHTGRIDSEFIAEASGHLNRPVYYVCGPPDMVTAMTGIIRDELEIPKSDLRFEKFTGY